MRNNVATASPQSVNMTCAMVVGARAIGAGSLRACAGLFAIFVLLPAAPALAKDPPPPRPPLDIRPKVAVAPPAKRGKIVVSKRPVAVEQAGPTARPAAAAALGEEEPPKPAPLFGPFKMIADLNGSIDAIVGPANVRLTPDEEVARRDLTPLIARHAQANGIPEPLVHRVIVRESRYHPKVVASGNYGLMQIKYGTARAMGYTGTADGLLDPETNLTYAVKYLAGAYRKAGGNEKMAIVYYARGYSP